MSNKLTITLKDIPDGLWKQMWRDARLTAKEEFGGDFLLKETEDITIDCDQLGNQAGAALGHLLGGAMTGHAIYQFDQEYNREP